MQPFTVHVEGDPEGMRMLVLAASHPYLLVGPTEGRRPRWVRADECEFGEVLFDRPWHERFWRPSEPPHEHESQGG